MKNCFRFKAVVLVGALFTMVALLSGGCSTTKKVDWNSRVGVYTFDQAVSEMGPPDKEVTLSTGYKVAEWITHHGGGGGLSIGTGYWGGNTGVGVSQSMGSGYKDSVLRLTFKPDGKLESWSKN